MYVLAMLAAGLALGRAAPFLPAAAWLAACQVALVVALLTRGVVCRAVLAASVVLFGGGWFTLRCHESAAGDIAVLLAQERADEGADEESDDSGILITLDGIVTTDPEPVL